MNYYQTIHYNPETGAFTWAVGRPGCSKGAPAGTVSVQGYLAIKLNRKRISGHRLAWFLVHGEWPNGSVDHINGVKLDNRIANLRVVDHATNMQNKRSAMSNNESCGLLGVTWNKQHKRWQSKLMVDGKNRHIGYFADPESAHKAYVAAKRRLHAGCTI